MLFTSQPPKSQSIHFSWPLYSIAHAYLIKGGAEINLHAPCLHISGAYYDKQQSIFIYIMVTGQ
jgi:hypothetical protein